MLLIQLEMEKENQFPGFVLATSKVALKGVDFSKKVSPK